MNIVIDTNIFISALIRDSTNRKLIINSKQNLLFPEIEFEEIKNHRIEILTKSGTSEREMDTLVLRLLNYVRIIPTELIINYKKQAEEIIKDIDKDDVIFIATAIAFNCPIWSEDKHFKKQDCIKVLTTKDMLKILD